eukprot:gene6636-7383_t
MGIEPKIVLENIVLIDALDERFDAGYNKPIVSLMDKDDIIMKLSRYCVISRQLEEIQQMCRGLNSFGLLESLKDFADRAIAESLYDPGPLKSSLIKNIYQVEYSKTGTEERVKEEGRIYQ